MVDAEAPSLEDLARLLETAAGGNHYEGVDDTARWLFETSDAGRRLYGELTAKPGERPSLLDLARVESAVTGYPAVPEALETAHWLIAQSATARQHLEALEQLAADAGIDARRKAWSWMDLLDLEAQMHRLVSAPDDWRHPSDVLDPTRSEGCSFTELYRLCRAKYEGSEGEFRHKCEAILEKLRRPAELERLVPLFEHLERLTEWLAQVGDAENAVDSLEGLARLLRLAQRPDEGE